jgi:probable rRNA maturation factor
VSANFTSSVDVQIACDDAGIPEATVIENWVRLALSSSDTLTQRNTEVAVRVVGAGEIQTLNSLYREQDKPTNVLSFPAGEVAGLPLDEPLMLGDIIICATIVSNEATAQGKLLADHWGHMLLHGTLHLMGFDHENDADAAEMEALEVSLLAVKGVADPYRAT